jgi:hypothetical protein
VATYPVTKGGLALSVSEGVDRDRAVDESGNQLSVFGRIGARPFNREELERMYLRNGKAWKVSDNPFDAELYRILGPQPPHAMPQPRTELLTLPPPAAGR